MNGKGSAPRKGQDPKAYASGWDRLFGSKAKQKHALDELTRMGQGMGGYERSPRADLLAFVRKCLRQYGHASVWGRQRG